MFAERIDEVGDEIFFVGASFDDFFFVSDDDFGIGDFDDFATVNGEFGVDETFDDGTFDDDLLDGKIVGSEGEVDNFSELGTFFGLDLEADEIEIESENIFNFDDVFGPDELVGVVDNHAGLRIFADGSGIEDVVTRIDNGARELEGDDLEIVGVDDRSRNGSNGAAGLDAEHWRANEAGIIY